jgi:transcriptional regulator with XRE-family HTH domain
LTIKYKDFRAKLLSDPVVRRAYDALAPEFELVGELIAARARAGLTQAQLAKRMGTTQSAIARLEGGRLPSVKTLQKFAQATGTRPVVKFVPLGKSRARRKTA